MFKPRPSPFIAEFAHTQLHSARAREITDRINGEGLGSEAKEIAGLNKKKKKKKIMMMMMTRNS